MLISWHQHRPLAAQVCTGSCEVCLCSQCIRWKRRWQLHAACWTADICWYWQHGQGWFHHAAVLPSSLYAARSSVGGFRLERWATLDMAHNVQQLQAACLAMCLYYRSLVHPEKLAQHMGTSIDSSCKCAHRCAEPPSEQPAQRVFANALEHMSAEPHKASFPASCMAHAHADTRPWGQNAGL